MAALRTPRGPALRPTCLHVYTWLFAQRLLSPHQLFPARLADASPAKRPRTGKEQPASQLLRHVQYWLHHTLQATAATGPTVDSPVPEKV